MGTVDTEIGTGEGYMFKEVREGFLEETALKTAL